MVKKRSSRLKNRYIFMIEEQKQNGKSNLPIESILWMHCNPLQGKYRFFTGNSLCSISTLTCFGSVQGLKGANFIEIQGNICILYRNIALDSYIHVYVLITGISLLFEKQQHRILEKQGKPCK